MIYLFGPFKLDLGAIELRDGRGVCKLEPQVFRLLALLVENRDRVVSKDEIIEKVWDGRIVSDAAVSSRIKSARQALGDDGLSQRFIKTVQRHGFRFVAEVRPLRSKAHAVVATGDEPVVDQVHEGLDPPAAGSTRPSLAVLPFRFVGDEASYGAIARALPDELITELSRLRWLQVTARGSSFRLHPSECEPADIGRLLQVRYCLCGTVEVADRRLAVIVELIDTRGGTIVWADRFSSCIDDVHALREEIGSRVLVALDVRIPIHEAAQARLMVSDDLDAWCAYHLGLQHMYRFNRVDNIAAAQMFERALTLDPCFARAHAGLSFVHFQAAFMHYEDDIAHRAALARRFAERGLELDPLDPFVNFTMGRSYWLEGDLDRSLGWLERATSICPHYAQGLYARAWTESLGGNSAGGRSHIDLAMQLSPIDSLHYAMLAVRSFTHTMEGDDGGAADWAERAARSPGAHVLIAMVAAVAHALNGDYARAGNWAANVRKRDSTLRKDDYLRAFPIKSEPVRKRVLDALRAVGF
jgi:TolB-like protein/DNA-binding winged helix-turn-helix (wHTH) protein